MFANFSGINVIGGWRIAATKVFLVALPLDVLERSINKKMALQLKDGRVIEGKLVGYDQYMNLVLEESEERHAAKGADPAEAAQVQSRRLGTVILRGNNVVTISPQ